MQKQNEQTKDGQAHNEQPNNKQAHNQGNNKRSDQNNDESHKRNDEHIDASGAQTAAQNAPYEEHRLIQDRKRKLEEIKSKGINPYPYNFEPTHHAKQILLGYEHLAAESKSGERATVAGRIMLMRRMGKAAFMHIQDMSGRIQLFCKSDLLMQDFDIINLLDIGDIVGASGEIIKTKTGEISILADKFLLLTKSIRPLPEKYHGLKDEEERFRKRYLDLMMNPEIKELFVKRAKIIQSVRSTLDNRGFLEVETPALQTMYGGANARPFITHINAWNMPMYLSVSPELYLKRLLVGGYDRVYTICKNFRNEGVDQTHNPEFTMMECYQAYADYNTMMEITEELYQNACLAVNGTTIVERNGVKLDFKAPWPRLKMKDAIKQYSGIDVDSLSDEQMRELIDRHDLKAASSSTRGEIILALFEKFCEEHMVQPVHVIDHPIESTPLCKTMRTGDKMMIERFESYCMGKELCNAYTELNDPILQRSLLEAQAAQLRAGADEAHPMDEDFVQSIEYGMPPAGGLGVGIDRMIIMILGVEGIRDIILFPTMRPEKMP